MRNRRQARYRIRRSKLIQFSLLMERESSSFQVRFLLERCSMVFGGLVAQSVEQCPFKALVVGSSPTQPTT